MHEHNGRYAAMLFAAIVIAGITPRVWGATTAFTYQGQLRRAGTPANGLCDFEFRLFSDPVAQPAIGTARDIGQVPVVNGVFTVGLDFGSNAFTGDDRWLEIGVRCPSGSDGFTILAPRQLLTPSPYALSVPIAARDANGNARATMQVLPTGEGFVSTLGPNGNPNVLLTSLSANPNSGYIAVYDENGHERGAMGLLASGEGFAHVVGAGGNVNVNIASLANHPNNGFVAVNGPDGITHAGMYVDDTGKGIVFGDMKSFAVDHPQHPDEKIVYTSLEGPQAAIFHRGIVHLVDGRAGIELPEHFTALANPRTITVQLTPASLQSRGLGVGGIAGGRIEIGELNAGTGSYDVYYVVHALRAGYEDRPAVLSNEQFRTELSPGRSPAHGDTLAEVRTAGQ